MSYTYILIDNYQKIIQLNDGGVWMGMDGFTKALPTETGGVLASFEWKNGSGQIHIVNNMNDNIPIEGSPFTVSSYSKYQPLIDLYLTDKAKLDAQLVADEQAKKEAEAASEEPDEV